jgi:hypothetical protein
MARRRSLATTIADFPAPLRRLVQAADVECPVGHAEALAELTSLALYKVPARGIFEPGTREEPELYSAIESVGRAHLELGDARARFRKALKVADLPLEKRDDIETAALEVQSASDTAYFYAGLAFGLAFHHLRDPR